MILQRSFFLLRRKYTVTDSVLLQIFIYAIKQPHSMVVCYCIIMKSNQPICGGVLSLKIMRSSYSNIVGCGTRFSQVFMIELPSFFQCVLLQSCRCPKASCISVSIRINAVELLELFDALCFFSLEEGMCFLLLLVIEIPCGERGLTEKIIVILIHLRSWTEEPFFSGIFVILMERRTLYASRVLEINF